MLMYYYGGFWEVGVWWGDCRVGVGVSEGDVGG